MLSRPQTRCSSARTASSWRGSPAPLSATAPQPGMCMRPSLAFSSAPVWKGPQPRPRNSPPPAARSTTGLLAPSGGAFCLPLLSELGLDPTLLPRLHPPSAPAGPVSAAAAAALGLPRELAGLPVFHCGGDLAATARGAGAPRHLYLGTSGWIAATVPDTRAAAAGTPPAPGVFRVAAPDPGSLILAGSMVTAGGCVEWARRALLGGVPPAQLDAAAAAAPPGARGVLFLPYLSGERSPFVDFGARGAFLGLSQARFRCWWRGPVAGVSVQGRAPPAVLLQRAVWAGGAMLARLTGAAPVFGLVRPCPPAPRRTRTAPRSRGQCSKGSLSPTAPSPTPWRRPGPARAALRCVSLVLPDDRFLARCGGGRELTELSSAPSLFTTREPGGGARRRGAARARRRDAVGAVDADHRGRARDDAGGARGRRRGRRGPGVRGVGVVGPRGVGRAWRRAPAGAREAPHRALPADGSFLSRRRGPFHEAPAAMGGARVRHSPPFVLPEEPRPSSFRFSHGCSLILPARGACGLFYAQEFFTGGGGGGGEPGAAASGAGRVLRFNPDEARSALYDRVYSERWSKVYPALAAAGIQGGGA